jgi:hypothetical protein
MDIDSDGVDITGDIGPDSSRTLGRPWPMYSFDRPSFIVWNAMANAFHKRGWTEEQIKDWLQSKLPRWALDGDLGEALAEVATAYAMREAPLEPKE